MQERKNFLDIFLILTLGLILFIPLSQFKIHLIPKISLQGIADASLPKKLSIATLKNDSFQKSFENYFMKGNPVWGWLVRINNQISFDIFNQITFNYNAQAFVGKENQLLQPMYLNSFNRQKTPPKNLLLKKAFRLKKLQSLLEKKGVRLLVFTNPNALTLYPELVPSSFVDDSRFSRENSYEIMKRNLSIFDVPLVDSYQLLLSKKNDFEFRFFEPTGSHLNEVGSCISTNYLLDKIKEVTKKHDIKSFPCFPVKNIFPPNGVDKDLLDIANLLFPDKLLHAGHYVPKAKKMHETFPLKLLFVGTSFNFAVQDHLYKRNISNANLYFYYRQLRSGDGTFHVLDKRKIDWENDIFKNDVIILESNYSGLGGVGYSFLSDAIIKLKKDLFKTKAELNAWKKDMKHLATSKKKLLNISQIETLTDAKDLNEEFNPFANR